VKVGLTLSEVSKITGRSVRTIRRWIAEGHLKTRVRESHEPANTPTLVEEKELERFLALSHRLIQAGTSDQAVQPYPPPNAEEIYQRVIAEVGPIVQELRRQVTTLQGQIEALQREQEMQREKPAPAKSVSPWRKLLGVE